MATPDRHFSMIRGFNLADFFTIANGFCGVAAIFQAMWFIEGHDRVRLYLAAALVPVALVFDVLDGRIARWRHQASPMGRELDSLADVISFGVAPATIAFAAGLRTTLDQAVLLYFTACGLSRLARYNITAEAMSADTGKVRYFEGTPIPSSVLLVALLMILTWLDRIGPALPGGIVSLLGYDFHPLSLLYVISGSLMISKTLHIPKL